MKATEFCYWLQGYFEILRSSHPSVNLALNHNAVESIQRHLALVFKHEIDPSYGTAEHQDELDEIHGGALVGHGANVVMRC